jgi:hypothetical protein
MYTYDNIPIDHTNFHNYLSVLDAYNYVPYCGQEETDDEITWRLEYTGCWGDFGTNKIIYDKKRDIYIAHTCKLFECLEKEDFDNLKENENFGEVSILIKKEQVSIIESKVLSSIFEDCYMFMFSQMEKKPKDWMNISKDDIVYAFDVLLKNTLKKKNMFSYDDLIISNDDKMTKTLFNNHYAISSMPVFFKRHYWYNVSNVPQDVFDTDENQIYCKECGDKANAIQIIYHKTNCKYK